MGEIKSVKIMQGSILKNGSSDGGVPAGGRALRDCSLMQKLFFSMSGSGIVIHVK